MSHRITTQTKITDKELAEAALTKMGYSYNIEDRNIFITSGPLDKARISLASGQIISDTDWHGKTELLGLNQVYSEVQIEKLVTEQAGHIESRDVLANGDIVITAQVSLL